MHTVVVEYGNEILYLEVQKKIAVEMSPELSKTYSENLSDFRETVKNNYSSDEFECCRTPTVGLRYLLE